jgi:2-C-methyl-D-erythritol 4-phosphate cytidylyltransferase
VNGAVVVAGGSGERFGDPRGKQLALVGGVPVLRHTVRAFELCDAVGAIVVVVHPDRVDEYRAALGTVGRKVVAVVPGGDTRRASVAAGLSALPDGCDMVAIHDGARAAITAQTIAASFRALKEHPEADGVVVGHPAVDTIKEVDREGRVISTPDRARLWIAQTPQTFRTHALVSAHERAIADGFEGTDDATLVERTGGHVRMIEGSRWNLKVTVPEDLAVLAALLGARDEMSTDE